MPQVCICGVQEISDDAKKDVPCRDIENMGITHGACQVHTLVRLHMDIILISSGLKGKVLFRKKEEEKKGKVRGPVWMDWVPFRTPGQGGIRWPLSGSMWTAYISLYKSVDQIY